MVENEEKLRKLDHRLKYLSSELTHRHGVNPTVRASRRRAIDALLEERYKMAKRMVAERRAQIAPAEAA